MHSTATLSTGEPLIPNSPINPATSLNENNPDGSDEVAVSFIGNQLQQGNLIEALNRQYEGYDEINKLMWLLK